MFWFGLFGGLVCSTCQLFLFCFPSLVVPLLEFLWFLGASCSSAVSVGVWWPPWHCPWFLILVPVGFQSVVLVVDCWGATQGPSLFCFGGARTASATSCSHRVLGLEWVAYTQLFNLVKGLAQADKGPYLSLLPVSHTLGCNRVFCTFNWS
jgi:hypothetical protein